MSNPIEDLKYGGRVLQIQKFREMDREIYMSKVKDVSGASLDEIAPEMGQLQLIAVDDNGKPRMVISGINLQSEMGVSAHLLAISPDGSPTVWIDADTGVLKLTQVDFNGSTLLGSLVQLMKLGNILQQTATVGIETRTLQIGMVDNGTYPEARIGFSEPASSTVDVPNGDFSTLDMSDWTQNVGVWTADSGYANCISGYRVSDVDPKITSSRFPVMAGSVYDFSARSAGQYGFLAMGSGVGIIDIKIEFYTASSGGSLVSTETIEIRGSAAQHGWATSSKNIEVPATATHAQFVAAAIVGAGYFVYYVSFDDFTVVPVAMQTALIFRDSGLYYQARDGLTKFIAGVSASLTFLQSASSGTDASTYTFASQPFGVENASRQIIITVMGRAAGARTIASVTVGGVTATQVVTQTSGSGQNTVAIYIASVPTGTTGNVVVDWSGGAMVRCAIGMYRVLYASSASEAIGVSVANPLTSSMSVSQGSVQVAVAFTEATATATWGGTNPMTEDFDINPEAGRVSGASRNSSSAGTVIATCTWTASTNPCYVAASFPAA